uniref:Periostin, osteoblast specific factor b n=1 Tax=Paramormyrops kingsleyae TaxID=1676925 RepID=A0A3B3RA96_9TELE
MKLLVVAALVVVLSVLDRVDSSAYDKIVSHSRIRAKKEGPNVCALQQVSGTKKKYFSTCRNWYQGSICGKKATSVFCCLCSQIGLAAQRRSPARLFLRPSAVQLAGCCAWFMLSLHFPARRGCHPFIPVDLQPSSSHPRVSDSAFCHFAALLNFHLLDSVLCSEAIMAGASYETLEGHNIEIGCDGESLTINGVKMVLKKDIVTSNGVIHLIDQVLMPDSAKQVMELVGASQSMYGDMVSELGLVSLMRPKMEYTLLAPFNAAFNDEVMAMDQDELRVILENHILKKKLVLSQLYNGQRLETISGKWLRVFIYRTAVCIENACMVRGSKEGINGALHLLRTFIKPADSNMFQILRSSGKFKIFLSLMEAAGLTQLLQQEGDHTLFAPTDDAFKGLSQQDIALLKRDVNALRTILLYHISNGIFIGGGLEGGVTNLLKSLQGNNLRVLLNNTIQVNSIEVSDPDVMASNGVIHYMQTLIYPEDLPVGSQELQTLLRRVVRHIQIKVQHRDELQHELQVNISPIIVLYFMMPVIEGEPTITKVTRVIEGEPTITKVTRVIEGEPTFTKVTRVIEGEPAITKVTRVIQVSYTDTTLCDWLNMPFDLSCPSLPGR